MSSFFLISTLLALVGSVDYHFSHRNRLSVVVMRQFQGLRCFVSLRINLSIVYYRGVMIMLIYRNRKRVFSLLLSTYLTLHFVLFWKSLLVVLTKNHRRYEWWMLSLFFYAFERFCQLTNRWRWNWTCWELWWVSGDRISEVPAVVVGGSFGTRCQALWFCIRDRMTIQLHKMEVKVTGKR